MWFFSVSLFDLALQHGLLNAGEARLGQLLVEGFERGHDRRVEWLSGAGKRQTAEAGEFKQVEEALSFDLTCHRRHVLERA